MRAIHPSPSGDPVRIGAKLRATRRTQGLTIEQLAEATGLTKGFLSRVERDTTSPSVATLVTICQVLSLPIGALFEDPPLQVVSLDAAPRINMGGTGTVEKLVTPRGEARLQILRSRCAPGASGGAQLYTINADVETVHVVAGGLTVSFTSSTAELGPGDTCTFPGREPHTWSNPHAVEADVIWTIVPAAWSGSA